MKRITPDQTITRPEAKRLYRRIIRLLENADLLNEGTAKLVGDIAWLEQLRLELVNDIEKRGPVEHVKQGKQHVYRKNPSVAQVLKVIEQQRKIWVSLKLSGKTYQPLSKTDQEAEKQVDEFLNNVRRIK